MQQKYTTLSGTEIEYDDTGEVRRFIDRVKAAVDDERTTEDDLVLLIYGKENPIMASHPLFPDRGYVDRSVLENPAYHVLADLLVRKSVAARGIDPKAIGKRFTLSTSQAAERLGITEAAVRKAIQDRRLAAWRDPDERGYRLDPKTLGTLKVGTTGNRELGSPLKYRAGYDPARGVTLRFRTLPAGSSGMLPEKGSGEEKVTSGTATKWQRAMVLTGQGGSLRAFLLVPGKESGDLAAGGFYVKGKFTIAMKVNNAKAAREAWEAFGDDQ